MNFPEAYRLKLLHALDSIPLDKVEEAIRILARAREEGRTIFVCGNGGSASTASHFVCDMVKGASYGRSTRFRIQALTDSLATITAYANDCSFEHIFVEQLKNFARPGDIVMALSGSGNSANVIRAVEYANSIACCTIALSGRDGGKLAPLAQLSINIPEPHMGRIEEAHFTICHMIGYYFMEEAGGSSLGPQV